MNDKLALMVNEVTRLHAVLRDHGIILQGVMVSHENLMELKAAADAGQFLVHDPKYKTNRLRLAGVPITAGDVTRQAP